MVKCPDRVHSPAKDTNNPSGVCQKRQLKDSLSMKNKILWCDETDWYLWPECQTYVWRNPHIYHHLANTIHREKQHHPSGLHKWETHHGQKKAAMCRDILIDNLLNSGLEDILLSPGQQPKVHRQNKTGSFETTLWMSLSSPARAWCSISEEIWRLLRTDAL